MAAELATSLAATEAERLEQAEALVRGFCGWHVAPLREDDVLTVDGTGSSILPLPSLKVVGISSIVEDGIAVDLSTVTWSASGWIKKRYGRWTCEPGGVVIILDHGHETVPAEVTAIVQAIAQRGIDNPGSLVRTQDGPFSETFAQTGFNQTTPISLLDSEKLDLGPYRILPI